MKETVIVLAFSVGITLCSAVFAQELPSLPNLKTLDKPIGTLLPQPIQDILGTGKKISEKVGNLPFFTGVSDQIKQGNFKPENVLSDFKGFWNSVNDWFTKNIGVSLGGIVQVVANLILWLLDFIIKLIKAGLGYITNL